MNEIQVFDNEEFGSIRTLMIESEPWFVGKDVAEALGYSNTRDAIAKHVDDEDKKRESRIATPSGVQSMIIINESGFYCLVLSSKLPTAKKFRRWVTSEVLPALRKTGTYTMPDAAPERPLTRDDYLTAARILASCRNERLPMVVTMLDKAGLDMEEVKATKDKTVKDPKIDEYEQEHMRAVLSRYTDVYTSKKMGLSRSLMSLYRNGQRVPTKSRYQYMMDVLDNGDDD